MDLHKAPRVSVNLARLDRCCCLLQTQIFADNGNQKYMGRTIVEPLYPATRAVRLNRRLLSKKRVHRRCSGTRSGSGSHPAVF